MDEQRSLSSISGMDKMLLIKPDYVLVQSAWSEVGTDPPDFMNNLRTIGQTVRGFNGIPILITLHAARTWDAQCKLIPHRSALIRQVAVEFNTAFIDLYPITSEFFSELGPNCGRFMR